MRRGFKTEARKLALQVREEMGAGLDDPFDPYDLATKYGVQICSLQDLVSSGANPAAVAHFTGHRANAFDAAVVPKGNGCFIVENTVHALTRRRNTMSHEMSHVVLEHPFTPTIVDSKGCRSASIEVEDEASCLGAELLIPYESALKAARAGLTNEEVAEKYCVSPRLAAFRMSASGARKVADRQRRFSRS